MPVAPTYPGVYIQEVPSGVRTITSVATSIAAFLGRATKGPINKAVRILNLSDFERKFGEPHAKSSLAASIRQFFDNGGTDCYVVRLAKGAGFASVTLKSLGGTEVLDIKANGEGTWANTVRVEIDYKTPNPDEAFNMTVIQEEGTKVARTERYSNLSMDAGSPRYAPSFVNQSSELVTVKLSATGLGDPADVNSYYNNIANSPAGASWSRYPLGSTVSDAKTSLENLIKPDQYRFQISVNDSPYVTVDLDKAGITATTTEGEIQNAIAGMINTALQPVNPALKVICTINKHTHINQRMLTITSDSGNYSSVRVKRAADKDIAAALMLGIDQGGIEPVRWSNFRPAPTASMLNLDQSPTVLDTLAILDNQAAPSITKITVDNEEVKLDVVGDEYNLKEKSGDPWYKNLAGNSTVTGDNDGLREKLRIIANAINANSKLTSKVKAEVWGYHLAIIPRDGTINRQITATTTVNAFDNNITPNVRQYTLGTSGTGGYSINGVDGSDGAAGAAGIPGYAEYIGNESQQTGFHALDPVDLFNLMIIPEDEEVGEAVLKTLWGPASTYCQKRRAFLIIDAPASWAKNGTGQPKIIGDTGLIDVLRASIIKDYAAVFFPRLKYVDSGLEKTIGPSGAIAGLMARTDANRGVWKAPAGIEAGIHNILGLSVELTDAENGVLNKKGVNCLRVFPNGIVNWGSRTLDGDDDFGSEWKYIPVRRLALNIEESLYRGTRWVVFEPNDEPLWAKIRLNVGAYMMSLFRQGAFQGSSPKEAFFVKCDKETTTQDDINKGIVNIRVGFAPLKPAEFVIITIQQMAGEL
jgi:phage tail sheath protein FI